MKTLDIVIAKYKEDISWVNDIPNYLNNVQLRKFVYSKNENESNSDYIRLPNFGREAHTYLHHIIKNYDDFAEYTMFSQGDPRIHICNFYAEHPPSPLDWRHYLSAAFSFDFFPLGYRRYVDSDCGYPNSYVPHFEHILKRFYVDAFGCESPEFFVYVSGAIFVVKRNCIRRRSIQFYENILGLMGKYPPYEQDGNIFLNYEIIMERMWPHIFT